MIVLKKDSVLSNGGGVVKPVNPITTKESSHNIGVRVKTTKKGGVRTIKK